VGCQSGEVLFLPHGVIRLSRKVFPFAVGVVRFGLKVFSFAHKVIYSNSGLFAPDTRLCETDSRLFATNILMSQPDNPDRQPHNLPKIKEFSVFTHFQAQNPVFSGMGGVFPGGWSAGEINKNKQTQKET
jgi:hypothetical protein